jgi:hypothetical protein
MKRTVTRVLLVPLLFVPMMIFSTWADSAQVTIIYSNNINGQVDPAG